MTQRLIIVTAHHQYVPAVCQVAEDGEVIHAQVYPRVDGGEDQAVHLVVDDTMRQDVLDRIQSILSLAEGWRITILPVDASIPFAHEDADEDADENGDKDDSRNGAGGKSREEIYNDVWGRARPDLTFVIFAALSTLVAAIGLIENNVAVVIGAMVIAPLLGPNLAFAVGVALGDTRLMARALATNGLGIAVSLALSIAIGLAWPLDLTSDELMARTGVGFDGMALALASGAAAALSLVTGLSSALVGVMVAVALLPPAATAGMMLGAGQLDLATGAFLLLAVNVVCVNLSAQVVLISRKITPRTWFEKKAAKRAVLINAAIWCTLLTILALLLGLR